MTSHFYIHLPSNSSEAYYPNNTRADYTTRLLNNIELELNYEVALVEIFFSKTWYNVKGEEGFTISYLPSDLSRHPVVFEVSISEGIYQTVNDLVSELNAKMTEFANDVDRSQKIAGLDGRVINWPTFRFNEKNNKVEVYISKGRELTFSDGLCRILGYRKKFFPIKSRDNSDHSVVESRRTADINDGLETFYIYCDLLEPVKVGHTEAPLLRIVDAGNEPQGSLVRRHYVSPIYVPVQKKNFDSIEISLRTDQGKPVPFERGRVILTLHFRKSEST